VVAVGAAVVVVAVVVVAVVVVAVVAVTKIRSPSPKIEKKRRMM